MAGIMDLPITRISTINTIKNIIITKLTTSMVFLKWLIDYDIDNKGQIIPSDFSWTIHSANPVGKYNIDSLLKAYMKFKLLKP